VAATDLLGPFPASMAPLMQKHLGLAVLEIPLALPPIPIYLIWHETRRRDFAHRWLRDLAAREIVRLAGGKALGNAGSARNHLLW
jgi:DNA-binding transcriptional LysR family regulator